MALHGRHTNALASDLRIQIKFKRKDLLWKTDQIIKSPYGVAQVQGLPLQVGENLVGPTILDMMTRRIVKVRSLPPELASSISKGITEVAVWEQRRHETLWPKPGENAKLQREVNEVEKSLDHPFRPGLASGGQPHDSVSDFILVEKVSNVSISDLAVRLAVGMFGDLATAYTHIGKLATQAWSQDLQRSLSIWHRIKEAPILIEDEDVIALRPLSSVSQEVERQIMRDACVWLGVDPDLDCRRGRGRPRGTTSDPGERGEVIRVTVTADNTLIGCIIKDFHGIAVGTDLSDLPLVQLVELLGALRLDDLEFDADLLEAFLDAAMPDWRETVASSSDEASSATPGHMDPYEVLGVPHDATLEDITKAYRRIMQRVHPDTSNMSAWFAQTAAAAYRSIRQARGEGSND